MNVLTDILCDTSQMMAPQNFKGILPQSKITQHDISSKQGPLLLLDSVSQISNIDRPLSTINHSSPSNINVFSSSGQIHIPSNIDSGFEERTNVSVFSDSFPEIVHSWLAHDFMKVSDTLPSPGILSNVSDTYSTNRENEHLELLDLGFAPELTSHDVVPNNINRSCIDDSQKLLAELPMQNYSSNEPLIIPSFNDINNAPLHISVNKNNMQYQKFKQNVPNVDSTRSLMNSVLPCENELLHLPLPSSITEQCLNSTSSPSIISSSQSQSHPVNVVCDKLPQINLNHLDSLLGNETALSDIQLLRQEFPNVRLGEDGCNSHTNRSCLDSYDPNGNIMPCDAGNIYNGNNPNLPTLPHSQDASVQVSINLLTEQNVPAAVNCYSCNEITAELPMEVIQCFKCKFCDYISIHKCAVASHITVSHSRTSNSINISENSVTNIRSDNFNPVPVGDQSETHFTKNSSLIDSSTITPVVTAAVTSAHISDQNTVKNSEKYPCLQCNAVFSSANEYNSHLLSIHNFKQEQVQLTLANNTFAGYQLISVNNIVLNGPPKTGENAQGSFLISNNVSNLPHSNMDKNAKHKIYPKKLDDLQKKNQPKKSVDSQKKNNTKKSGSDSTAGNEKNISSHKKAWQKKMKRELGSYICEFKGCNVRFRALDNLEYHRKCHASGQSAFSCPECGMSFDKWGTIAGHLWRTHQNDMELHACDQCPFRTFSLSRLENLHKRIHRDECLFLCDTCGKSFKNRKQLRNHRERHSKKKPKSNLDHSYICDICSKGFHVKRLLLLHQSIVHNKIKPFMCKYCTYAASKKSTMDLHMRQHTGEKPFKCDECSYCTSDHNSLRRHRYTHSGEKPYKCPYCTYSCIQASTFKDHVKKKHPEEKNGVMFSCNLCSFRTVKQETYMTHMSEHESQNRPPVETITSEINSSDEIFPLAKAMDISLSQSDNLLSNFNKNKNIESFFNNLSVNMVSNGQASAN